MPLDLKKTLKQIKSIEGQNLEQSRDKCLSTTFDLLKSAINNQDKLKEKVKITEDSGLCNFSFASLDSKDIENIDISKIISPSTSFKTPHICISTDGSQINPSAHEISSTSLINIGRIAIPYFNKEIQVELSSNPTVYSSSEDINPELYDLKTSDEDLISFERTLKEIEDLVLLAKKYKDANLPIVAFLDGTLIHWHIEKLNIKLIEQFISRLSNALLELKTMNIPVASYISSSRSNDFINMLKVFKCPFDTVDCKKNCSSVSSKNLPCNPMQEYKPVLDRVLLNKFFKENNSKPGDRTILLKSNSNILNYYPDDLKIQFFYINTGTEVSRVEIPNYVAHNKELLELVHNTVVLQCNVGYGYPVVISEAHLQAVVTKSDRQVFYDLIKEQFLKGSKSPIKLSTKELKKRVSFV